MKPLAITYPIVCPFKILHLNARSFAQRVQHAIKHPHAIALGWRIRLTNLPRYVQKQLFDLAEEWDPTYNWVKVSVPQLASFFHNPDHIVFNYHQEIPFLSVEECR